MSEAVAVLIPEKSSGWSSARKLVVGLAIVLALTCGPISWLNLYSLRLWHKQLGTSLRFYAELRNPPGDVRAVMVRSQAIQACVEHYGFDIPGTRDTVDTWRPVRADMVRRTKSDHEEPSVQLLEQEKGLPFLAADVRVLPCKPLSDAVKMAVARALESNRVCLAELHTTATESYGQSSKGGRWELQPEGYQRMIGLLLMASVADANDGRSDEACERLFDGLALTRLTKIVPYSESIHTSDILAVRSSVSEALAFVLNQTILDDFHLNLLSIAMGALDDTGLVERETEKTLWTLTNSIGGADPFVRLSALRVLDQLEAATRRGALQEAAPAWRALCAKYKDRIPMSAGKVRFDTSCDQLLKIQTDLRVDAANMAAGRLAIALRRYHLATGTWPETVEALAPAYCDAESLKAVKESGGRYEKNEQGVVVSVMTKADVGPDRPFSLTLCN